MTSFGHGLDEVFKVANVGGTLTDISNTITGVTFTADRDTVEVTTLGATYKDWLNGLQDAGIAIEGIWDPTADALLFALGTANTTTWEYHPQGTQSSKVKFSGTATRGNYDAAGARDAAVTYSCNFKIKGAVTRGTN